MSYSSSMASSKENSTQRSRFTEKIPDLFEILKDYEFSRYKSVKGGFVMSLYHLYRIYKTGKFRNFCNFSNSESLKKTKCLGFITFLQICNNESINNN